MQINTESKSNLEKLFLNSRHFIESCLKVVCKGELVDFKLRFVQEKVLEAVEKQRQAGKPVRLIILKARREGISTLIEALLYHRTSTRPHVTGMVIAHDLDTAKEIFEITRRFHTYHKKPSIRPMQRSVATRAIIFDNPNPTSPVRGLDSKIIVETAHDVSAGVGMEINYLHMSEVARYPDADKLASGLLQCVNMSDPESIVIKESTGYGISNYFYDEVQRAINKESDYDLIFLPWFIFEDYKLEPPKEWKPKDREEKVKNKYQYEGNKVVLTNEQLYWREKKIENDLKGVEADFFENFPGSIDEAFQFTGRTRFNQEKLTEIQSKARLALAKGFLNEEKDSKRGWIQKFEENENGWLTIFEKPIPHEKYVLFFDISEGIEKVGRDTDYSAGDVLRCSTLEQVAHFHARIAPEYLDDEIIKLARWYNNAFVGIEKNSIGYGVVASVKERYSNLYVREVHDKLGNLLTKEYGWRTTGGRKSGTKALMIQDLADHINEGLIQINHPGTIEECRRFSVHPDGSLAAPQGCHDDRTIALSGALQMYIHTRSGSMKDKVLPKDDDDEFPEYELYDERDNEGL